MLESLKIRIVRIQRSYFSCLLSIRQLYPSNIYLQVRSFPVFKALLGACFTLKNVSDSTAPPHPHSESPDFLWTLCTSLFLPHCSPGLWTGNCWRVEDMWYLSLYPPWGHQIMFLNVTEACVCCCCWEGYLQIKMWHKYLQKWLFVTDLYRKQSNCTPCTSLVSAWMFWIIWFSLTSCKTFFFFLMSPDIYFHSISSDKKVFETQGSFLSKEWLVL